MTDIPIIFSAAMVKAHLAGAKHMTRRLAWRTPSLKKGSLDLWASPWRKVKAGDRLWVRENVKLISQGPDKTIGIIYPADEDPEVKFFEPAAHKLKLTGITPCIHMPRYMSRVTLIVTATKIEPLHDMTIQDAMAEGMAIDGLLTAFPDLWDRLHGKGAWAKNPEVVAISYDVVIANIDSEQARAAA